MMSLVLTVEQANLLELSTANGPVTATPEAGGGGGTVTAVTASPPLVSSGGATPNITNPSFGLLVWQSAIPSAGNHVQTWAEVQAAIAAGCREVWIKGAAVTPGSSGLTDVSGVRFQADHRFTLWEIQDGAVLHNLSYTNQLSLEFDASTTSPLTFDPSWTWVSENCAHFNGGGAAVPVISLGAGNTLFMFFRMCSFALAQPMCNPAAGETVTPQFVDTLSAVPASFFGGAGTVNVTLDDTYTLPVGSPIFNTATITGTPGRISKQSAQSPSFTTTVARPTNLAPGQPSFDSTLGIPIWWNGTNWVNASGAIV